MSIKMKSIFQTVLLLCLLLVVGSVKAQNVTKGTVTDANGDPVIGATVMEKGNQQNATVTDYDGNFSLKVSGKNPIVVSYIGMKPKTVDIKGKSQVNIKLEEDNTMLNDIVVIGYGTVRKKDLTGSVASLSADKVAEIPVSNVGEAMTGKLAGVNITTTEGSPDADVKIRVRGGGSLSQDNSPLYIVDGFPVSSISDIAPSEIESIDVLKDASSTAIYGARGANGVIIVTTKSGKEGNVQVNFNASHGWKKITKEVKVMDPYNFAMYQYELDQTSGNYGNFNDLDIWKSVEGTDYQDEVFGRTGHQNNYNVNVSGGTKELKFNVGLNHIDEKSIMMGSGYSKNNISAKLNAQLNKWLSMDFNARMAFTKLDGLSGGADTNESNAANSIVANTVHWAPVESLTESGDDDEENSTSTRRTPYQRIDATYKLQDRLQQSYNAGLNWKPFKGITFRSEYGYTWKRNETDQVWGSNATTNSKYGYNGAPQSQFIRSNYESWRNANTVTYDNKKLFGNHHINVLLGQEWSSAKQTTRTSTSVAYPTTMTINEVLSDTQAGTALPNESDIAAKETMLSFFGRVNYTIADKYLATFTMRADGSSKFGDGHRWGVFPSLALAWRMNEENFLKNVKWLDNLKLRLSWGTAGNNRINSGLILSTYSMAANTAKAPFFNEERTAMLERGTYLYNPDLKWETTVTRNIGLDFGFFRGRINGTLDFYWNTTKDLLMQSVIPANSGYSYQFQNFGRTSNKGVELTVNASIIEKKNFNLNFNFNISYNKNKIDELNLENPWQSSNWSGSTISKYEDFRVEEGGRLGEIWGYKYVGFYTPYDAELNPNGELILDGTTWKLRDGINDKSSTIFEALYPGAPKVEVDENGDPIKQRLGNTIPTTTGGFGLDGSYKTKFGTFDANVFFNYSLGNKIVNGTKLANAFYAGSQKGYNLVSDFNLTDRYTWIDPNNGLNLGRPSSATIAEYGGSDKLVARLLELNQNAGIYNPAAVAKMQLIDWAVEDASFLRLQSVTLGYTLPKSLVKKFHIENVRIYGTGHNLLCFTKYEGYDPEVDTSSKKNPMTPGIDYAAYPKSRTYVIGINVTF